MGTNSYVELCSHPHTQGERSASLCYIFVVFLCTQATVTDKGTHHVTKRSQTNAPCTSFFPNAVPLLLFGQSTQATMQPHSHHPSSDVVLLLISGLASVPTLLEPVVALEVAVRYHRRV